MKTIPDRFSPCRVGAIALLIALTVAGAAKLQAQSPYSSTADFAEHARMLRERELLKVEPQVFVPSARSPVVSAPRSLFASRSPWKENIVTTVFWIGELPTKNNPTPNHASSWDRNGRRTTAGTTIPIPRAAGGTSPPLSFPGRILSIARCPTTNVTRGTTKPEARVVIPWFKQAFQQEGHSVCKDHWVAIRHGNRICYAQWSGLRPVPHGPLPICLR